MSFVWIWIDLECACLNKHIGAYTYIIVLITFFHSILKRLNPVWTVHNGSLFMVSCSAEEFFSFSYGLVFCVKDYDLGKKDDLVGRVELSQEQLLSMTGERIAVELDIPQEMRENPSRRGNSGNETIYTPKLYLRVRKATSEDKKFIMTFNEIKQSKRAGVYTNTSFNANGDLLGLFKRESKKVDGVKLVSRLRNIEAIYRPICRQNFYAYERLVCKQN